MSSHALSFWSDMTSFKNYAAFDDVTLSKLMEGHANTYCLLDGTKKCQRGGKSAERNLEAD
jgi:hypothetical protein